jgi:hypothetical protein
MDREAVVRELVSLAKELVSSRGQYSADDLVVASSIAAKNELKRQGEWQDGNEYESVLTFLSNSILEWLVPTRHLRDFAPQSTSIWSEPIFRRREVEIARKKAQEVANKLGKALSSGKIDDVDGSQIFISRLLGPLNKIRIQN